MGVFKFQPPGLFWVGFCGGHKFHTLGGFRCNPVAAYLPSTLVSVIINPWELLITFAILQQVFCANFPLIATVWVHHCFNSIVLTLCCVAGRTLVIGLCARYKPVIGFMWFSRDVNTLAQYLELLTIQWEFPSLERQTARLLQSNVISIYLSWRFIVSSIHVFLSSKVSIKGNPGHCLLPRYSCSSKSQSTPRQKRCTRAQTKH